MKKNLISISDLSKKEILSLLNAAKKFKKNPTQKILENKIIASCFFEPSTRTRLSFESAALRLGAKVIGFSDDSNLSVKKGETLSDTVQMISAYADLIVIRHPQAGSAQLAADASDRPVINAGDSSNEHPTQTLTDLFTIQEFHKKLEGVSIALVGDLKYGRTIHSLIKAGALFRMNFLLVPHQNLSIDKAQIDFLKKNKVQYSIHRTLEEVLPKVDVLYMTRLQKERFSHKTSAKNNFILTVPLLKKAKPNLCILHPFPRNEEIDVAVDLLPQAYYFQQAKNGLYVRQALLAALI